MHFCFCLADREAADGNPGERQGGDELCRGGAEVRIHTALEDAEKSLVRPGVGSQGSFCPAMGALHGDLRVGMVVGIGTLVKGHDDIRAEVLLDLDGAFRCEAVARAVDVRFESDAILIDLARFGERKDLETARVGQHGSGPLHEFDASLPCRPPARLQDAGKDDTYWQGQAKRQFPSSVAA